MGAGIAYLDGKIFIIGGVKPPKYEPVLETSVYDIKEKKWLKKANIPVGKASFATVVCNGKIYVFGGNVYDKMTTLEYDPVKDKWTEKAPMPTPRQQLAAECLNGKIYTFGGSQAHNISLANTFEVYNPVLDKWEVKSKLSTPLQNCASLVYSGKIYAIAGHSIKGTGNTGDLIMRYDAASDKWTKISNTNKKITDISATVYGNKIYIFGGHPGLSDVEVYDVIKNRCSSEIQMPAGRWGHNSVLIEDKIFILNGNSEEIWSFNPLK
jgi:N-acetylneuraminic acid mutarotase